VSEMIRERENIVVAKEAVEVFGGEVVAEGEGRHVLVDVEELGKAPGSGSHQRLMNNDCETLDLYSRRCGRVNVPRGDGGQISFAEATEK